MSDDLVKLREYLFEYQHNGAVYGITIVADDAADAIARMGRMSLARYCGEVKAKIPASLGWLAKLRVWWGNL